MKLSNDTIMMFLEMGMIILIMVSLSLIAYGIFNNDKIWVKISWIGSGIFGLVLLAYGHELWLYLLHKSMNQ